MMTLARREFLKVSASAITALVAGNAWAAPLKLRKNVNALTSAELAVFRAGVTAMQAHPRDDVLSWEYQRGVHNAPLPTPALLDPASAAGFWRKCQHHTDHFFDWHRWELLYWEEICRQLCGTPAFTLPYWDYFTDGHLPAAFRAPPPGGTNVLYHSRFGTLNDGTVELNTIAAGFGEPAISPTGLSETDFFAFAGAFEFNPHDLVHGYVGGDMSSIRTAALDPVFYVHHANVDRYWARWLKQGGGRANPTGAWAATTFDFQTVAGAKTVTAAAANTPEALGYTYDGKIVIDVTKIPGVLKYLNGLKDQYRFPPIRVIPMPPRPPGPGPDPGPWKALAATSALKLDGHPAMVRVPRENEAARDFMSALSGGDTEMVLTLYNVQSTRIADEGGYVYQVFLAPSQKELAEGRATSAVQVGSFSAFSVSAAREHAEHDHGASPRLMLPLNSSTRKLLATSLKRDPTFVFVRRGLISKGREIQDKVDEVFFTIDEVRIEARKRAKH
jgi:hypothetical protein